MKKSSLITLIIILLIIIFAVYIKCAKSNPNNNTNNSLEELAKCIGQKATLYTQLGCRACIIQEEMFGEDYQYLNVVDCFYEREKCSGITHTPSWIIGEKLLRGVQSIEKLKELTGC